MRSPTSPIPRVPELSNPNGKVPEWSYGYRSTLTGTELTLYAAPPDEHSNAALLNQNDDMEGWQKPNGFWPIIAANISGTTIIPAPNLAPLAPDELYVHPGNGFSSDTFAIVRWTAQSAGTYNISSTWRDLDPNGGDGFGAHIVLNGVSIFDANPPNGGNTSDTRTLSLSAGDLVDFVVDPGPSGNQNFDATALSVTIKKPLRIFLNWDPQENTVPRNYSLQLGPFNKILPRLFLQFSTPVFRVFNNRQSIQDRVRTLFNGAGVAVEFTDSSDGSVTVNFLQIIPGFEPVGVASQVDRYNQSPTTAKYVDIFVTNDTPAYVEFIATTIAHEVGHTLGLVHSGDLEEVMRCENITNNHSFMNFREGASLNCPPSSFLGSQNPVYYLRSWVNRESDESLQSQNIFPGSRDSYSDLERILVRFTFGKSISSSSQATSPIRLYDVNVFANQVGEAFTLLTHFDEIDLDALGAIDFPLRLGEGLSVFASSADDGRPNDVALALSGDPFDQSNLTISVVSGQQSAALQMQTSSNTFATLADASVNGSVGTAPTFTVVSRKSHGMAGFFEIDLPTTGSPGIECRTGGPTNDYQVVFKFNTPVTFASPSVISGMGSVTSTEVNEDQTEVTVSLTGVASGQTITVTLPAVNNGADTANLTVQMAVLVGDINSSGIVNSSDVSQVKLQSGHAISSSNFREDVTGNGQITSSDVALVKAQSGTGLP